MEEEHRRAINAHSQSLTDAREDLVETSSRLDSAEDVIVGGFKRVDKDLETLVKRVNRRAQEIAENELLLNVARDTITALDERSKTQQSLILTLMGRVDKMEGQLCHCWRKEGEAIVVDDSPVSSPLVESGLLPPSPEVDEDEELEYATDQENEVPLPVVVRPPALNHDAIRKLIAVRGQRARPSRPKMTSYHPYRLGSPLGSSRPSSRKVLDTLRVETGRGVVDVCCGDHSEELLRVVDE